MYPDSRPGTTTRATIRDRIPRSASQVRASSEIDGSIVMSSMATTRFASRPGKSSLLNRTNPSLTGAPGGLTSLFGDGGLAS